VRGGKATAVLWIHGGGWRAGNKKHIPACILPVLAQGFVVASVGYRKSTTARELYFSKTHVHTHTHAHAHTLGGHLGLLFVFGKSELKGSQDPYSSAV